MGYVQIAGMIESEWNLLRQNYTLSEEYYGYFIDDYIDTVESIIDDMLVQVSPFEHAGELITPVKILNAAWYKFMEDPDAYPDWEKDQIESFLNTHYFK